MKQGKLENLDIYIPSDWLDSKCTEKQFNVTSLLCWLSNQKDIVVGNLPTYEDNTEAASLKEGTIYKTSTGALRVKV